MRSGNIVREFVERGVSGENELTNRPALTALLEALAANGVRHILIEHLDRLSRHLLTQESILAEVRRRGSELISALEADLASDGLYPRNAASDSGQRRAVSTSLSFAAHR